MNLAANFVNNTYYAIGYLGTTINIGSAESLEDLIESTSYIAPYDVTLKRITLAVMFLNYNSVTTGDFEFVVVKVPFANDSSANIDLASACSSAPCEIEPDALVNLTMTKSKSYILNLDYDGADANHHLSAGEGLTVLLRCTSNTGPGALFKAAMRGQVTAELVRT